MPHRINQSSLYEVEDAISRGSMGLSYHFTIAAPGSKSAGELESFLKSVESVAKSLGFTPTMVLDAQFDSDERRSFAKRLTRGLIVEDEGLKGVVMLSPEKVWSHDPVAGYCRVIPERGVVLVITDEQQCELVFGFFQYPSALLDINQCAIASTGVGGRWLFSNFVDSSDLRYRKLIRLFSDAGYLESEKDEFADCRLPPIVKE